MSVSVFLSYPRPYLKIQQDFVDRIHRYLVERNFSPRTLGVTDYDMDAPLTAIRRLLLESNGLISIGFRKSYIKSGKTRPSSDLEENISEQWLTTPWCHIEAAMAFQIGLPVVVFRENGVMPDGIMEKGILGTYMPVFDLSKNLEDYFNSTEYRQVIQKWENYVGRVVENKGQPPKLY